MYLIKLTVSKDAAIGKEKIREEFSERFPKISLNDEKPSTDAIRCALSYRLRPWGKFEKEGYACKAIAATPKSTPKGKLHIEIHVQERSNDGVNYTARVCTITYTPENGLDLEPGDDYERYACLVDSIDAPTLEEFGKNTLLEYEIRKILNSVLADSALKFWSGTHVCVSESRMDAIRRAAIIFGILDTGYVAVRTLTLDNSEENRREVAEHIAENVIDPQFEDLICRAEGPGPNVERLEQEYEELINKIDEIQAWLDTEIPCIEMQEMFEIALSALYN